MKEINDYRKRFYNLMESTIGDVRSLISEQSEYPKPTPPPSEYPKPTPHPGIKNIPLPEPVTTEKGRLGTALSVHKVSAGENLTDIAKTYGVTVDQILKSNPQIKNMIKVGEIINIER